MRIILGILSGLLGALAGWFGLAFLIVVLSGPDRDGGIAMGAFFNIGPIGGIVGFIAGVWLFSKIGVVRNGAATPDAAPDAEQAGTAPSPRTRISRPFAVCVLLIAGGLAWWAWYDLIRSPYLTHGFMTLDLQFRLPAGMSLPASSNDAQVTVEEGDGLAIVTLGERWHGHDGDRAVILATADLDKKTSHRVVRLSLPGTPEQIWRLDLGYDPDPTPGYTVWQLPNGASGGKIEMNYRLRAD
jgi:hypothetical protein